MVRDEEIFEERTREVAATMLSRLDEEIRKIACCEEERNEEHDGASEQCPLVRHQTRQLGAPKLVLESALVALVEAR